MATVWVCPIDGCLPADNGTNTATLFADGSSVAQTLDSLGQPTTDQTSNQVALNGAAAIGDWWGNPPHCPVCSSAMIVGSATKVTAATGISSGSQHPIDYDATYTAADSSLEAQFGATSYTMSVGEPVFPHAYTGSLTRGTATITAETVNTTVGP